MQYLLMFALACAVRWSYAQNTAGMPPYDQRYDYLDVDGILDSRRLVRNYVDCLINVKPCTPEGKALKRVLPEALRTKCARCSERQKRVAVKVLHRMKMEYPEEWGKLAARWDPNGDFSAYFEHVLAKEHFNTIAGNSNEYRPNRRPADPPAPPPPPPSSAPPDVIAETAPTAPQPPPSPPPANTDTTPALSTSPRPLILNRFGDEDDEDSPMPMPSNNNAQSPTPEPAAPPRPTPIPWDRATAPPAPSNPTRFTFRPAPDLPPLHSTTVTLIDHFGSKILRTTELVADILRNTVRVLGG